MYRINKLFNKGIFQGKYKRKNYFEGWYFKLKDNSGTRSLAIIPGIAYGNQKEDHHAFIQIIEGQSYSTLYLKYPISDFSFNEEFFEIKIGKNKFNSQGISLNIDKEKVLLKGDLSFYEIVSFPRSRLNPGIMGPFSFISFLECNHEIINISEKTKGILNYNGQIIDFNGGMGYLEKDWGKSFPEWWIWMQSTDFSNHQASFMLSIAKIPFLGNSFTGFLAYLKLDGVFYRLATYTGGKIKKLEYQKGKVQIAIEDRKYRLLVSGSYEESGVLKAPKNGLMSRKISESITGEIKVSLYDKKGKLIFEDQGANTGLEIVKEDAI